MTKKKKWSKTFIAFMFISGITMTLTYGQWEALTLLHGKEFSNSITVDDVVGQTGGMLYTPKFIKVISYSDKNASILWVLGGKEEQHTVAEFSKKRLESGKLVWAIETWHICTPKNGSPTCYFPWYGGISKDQ